jgi:hypothetical protein
MIMKSLKIRKRFTPGFKWGSCYSIFTFICNVCVGCSLRWRIKDIKLGGGAHLKKLRRAEGGAKIVGVFRVKNHDFTPKNHIFSNFMGARAGCAPAGSAPALCPCPF